MSANQNCKCSWFSYVLYQLLLFTLGTYLGICSQNYQAINSALFTNIKPFGSLLLYDY
jgi:hypothetical protein